MPSPHHFTAEERQKTRKRILELVQQGLGNVAIADKMKEEGYSSPRGDSVTPQMIAGQVLCMGGRDRIMRMSYERARKTASEAASPRPGQAKGPQAPDFVLSTLTDPFLSPEKKLALLTTYYS